MSEPFDEQPDGDPHGECAAEIHRLEARITELEERLEIGTGPYDGIAARDETIRLLEARLVEQTGSHNDLVIRKSDQITELSVQLAHAEAENARMRVDAGRLDWLEDNSYALPYKDHGAGPELDLSRPAIDALMKDQNHSANTVGGPTPVMDAAPACEQLADNEDAVYAVAYKLCLQDGADEDSAHTLIWEGHPPEPWGEVWMRYEFQARELLKALDERRALMANHQATFQSGHECVSRVSNGDSQMNKQDDTRNAGESDRYSDGRMKKEK